MPTVRERLYPPWLTVSLSDKHKGLGRVEAVQYYILILQGQLNGGLYQILKRAMSQHSKYISLMAEFASGC